MGSWISPLSTGSAGGSGPRQGGGAGAGNLFIRFHDKAEINGR